MRIMRMMRIATNKTFLVCARWHKRVLPSRLKQLLRPSVPADAAAVPQNGPEVEDLLPKPAGHGPRAHERI